MNVIKLNQDLKIAQALLGIENVTWNTLPHDRFIILKRLRLPDNIMPNTTSVKIPIPENIYDPAGKGEFYYYQNVFVDPSLRVLYPNGKYGQIPRHHDAPIKHNDAGWRFLCLYPKGRVDERANISYFIRLLQVWFKNCLELN